jgi:hypothetical protein
VKFFRWMTEMPQDCVASWMRSEKCLILPRERKVWIVDQRIGPVSEDTDRDKQRNEPFDNLPFH